MDLPKAFLERMKVQLKNEYDDFLSTYAEAPAYGLRINLLKAAPDAIAPELPFTLSPVPWAKEGFYADPAEHPGRHPLHEAGLYYIQEPSAMSVVSLLDPEPGDIILDLCAAPGGKSTQIAVRLQGEGLLVSNEIIPGRAKILSQNIERMGTTNAIVSNEDPKHLSELFPLFFDKIVVDAPCSGEGMFRKDDTAIQEWSPEQVHLCGDRQHMILSCADQMLQPGGVLVYSTCTFAPEENEEQIERFLTEHPDYILEDWWECSAFQAPNSGITNGTLPGTMRLWPHKVKGEGHFVARLRKKGTPIPRSHSRKNTKQTSRQSAKKQTAHQSVKKQENHSDFMAWQEQSLHHPVFDSERSHLQFFGDELYQIPNTMKDLSGMKILRAGLHLGTRKKNRFEPAHALAKALTPKDAKMLYHCTQEEALLFLHGDTLNIQTSEQNPQADSLQGWTLLCYEGYPLGWGKAGNGVLKNHYPKGLRIANITVA